MKILLLALVLGLVPSDQAPASEPDLSKMEGNWRTIYMAADNEENGSQIPYFRRIECSEGCQNMTLSFYDKSSGTCKKNRVRREEIVFYRYGITLMSSADEYLYLVRLSVEPEFNADHLKVHVRVPSDDPEMNRVPRQAVALSRGNDLSKEGYRKFVEETERLGIPKENIQRVIDTDTCPE